MLSLRRSKICDDRVHPQIQDRANCRPYPLDVQVRGKRALRNCQPAAGRGRQSAIPGQEQEREPRAGGGGERSYPLGKSEVRIGTGAMPRYREFARAGAVQRTWTAPDGNSKMFKILELKGAESAAAAQVGQHRYSTREEALAA